MRGQGIPPRRPEGARPSVKPALEDLRSIRAEMASLPRLGLDKFACYLGFTGATSEHTNLSKNDWHKRELAFLLSVIPYNNLLWELRSKTITSIRSTRGPLRDPLRWILPLYRAWRDTLDRTVRTLPPGVSNSPGNWDVFYVPPHRRHDGEEREVTTAKQLWTFVVG
jgi:hypothetical protein